MLRDDLVDQRASSRERDLSSSIQLRWSPYARHIYDRRHQHCSLDCPIQAPCAAEKGRDKTLCVVRHEYPSRDEPPLALHPYGLESLHTIQSPLSAESEPLSPKSTPSADHGPSTHWDCLRGSLEEALDHSEPPTFQPWTESRSRPPRLYSVALSRSSSPSRSHSPYMRQLSTMKRTASHTRIPPIPAIRDSDQVYTLPSLHRMFTLQQAPISTAGPSKLRETATIPAARRHVLARLRQTTKQRLRTKLAKKAAL